MRILVTGHRGLVGVPVAGLLRDLGHQVTGFDLADGQDLLDAAAVRRAAEGCAAVVHLGALANDTGGSPERIMAVNVLDVRDVATAVGPALIVPVEGHHRVVLCAADIAATAPSLELAGRLAPGVPVTGPDRYRADPWRALVDCSAAEAALGWRPAHRWSQR